MSRQYSPFAALSSREQQARWLEFQNTRLPFIDGDMEPSSEFESVHTKARETDHPQSMEAKTLYTPQTFYQAQHRQYDAVIKRMEEAAKQTLQFRPMPPLP